MNISDALIYKYGFMEGLSTRDGEITEWPYDIDQPAEEELIAIVDEYEAHRAVIKAIDVLEAKINPRRIRDMATDAGMQWMVDLEAEIAALREQL